MYFLNIKKLLLDYYFRKKHIDRSLTLRVLLKNSTIYFQLIFQFENRGSGRFLYTQTIFYFLHPPMLLSFFLNPIRLLLYNLYHV